MRATVLAVVAVSVDNRRGDDVLLIRLCESGRAAGAATGATAAQRNRHRGVQIQIADILDFEIFLRKIEFRIDPGFAGGHILDFCTHVIPLLSD
jgi:hypothetical protein